MYTKVSIYDMDGTIVCSLHRYRTMPCNTRIDLDHWRANSHRAYFDNLLPLANQYKKDLLNKNTFVIIATARLLGSEDRAFISDKLGEPDAIVSRRQNDTRGGGQLKIEGITEIYDTFNLWDIDAHFWEDNKTYLKAVCGAFSRIVGHFVPSLQGH
jgi:hypothetical protein